MTLLSRLNDNLWLVRTCRDVRTLRAMKLQATGTACGVQSLRFRGLEPPLLHRPGSTDVAVAWELFHHGEYECARPWDFPTVVDCGANVGMFLAFVLMRMGDRLSRYVGVEADPESFRLLERQVEGLGVATKSKVLHAAAWDVDGEVSFDDRGPSWGRRVSDDGGMRVRAVCIDSILDAAGMRECHLLKLDIEGGERAVLPRMKDWGPRVRTVVAELHDGLDYPWFAAIAEDAGFVPFPPGELFRLHPSAIRRDLAR
jgi:FkbM family methyltransferase